MMAIRAIIIVCIINMIMAIYMGLYIPVDLHEHFALSARDYFLTSFIGLCFGILSLLKCEDES